MSHNPKEEVYDTQIHPLMERIAEIAKEHDISLVFAADIGRDDFDRPQVVPTIMLFEGCQNALWNTKHVLFDNYRIVPPPIDEDVSSEEHLLPD